MRKYTITIVEVDEDVPYERRVWQQLVNEPDEKHENIYGYVTEKGTKTEESEIFKQTVEVLDLKEVVSVINGVGERKV